MQTIYKIGLRKVQSIKETYKCKGCFLSYVTCPQIPNSLCVLYFNLMHIHKCKINCTNDSKNRSSFQALQTDQSKMHNNRKKLFVFIVYTSIWIWIDFFCWHICWLIAIILNNIVSPFHWKRTSFKLYWILCR